MNNVSVSVRKDLNSSGIACCAAMIQQINVAPAIPSIDPTAPPIRVLRVALRIRVSKKIIETASTPPMIAEISGFPELGLGKGFRK
jgi:hypothetical protein